MKRIFTYGLLLLSVAKATVMLGQRNVTALAPSSHTTNAVRQTDGVTNFSGVAPVKIPIYTLRSGQLSHSIALHYASQGNRVEDEAGWVGLGFSLQVGGTITRTVRGMPDEKTGGFFNGAPSAAAVGASPALLQQAVDNQIDTHPDVFYYNFDGYSGKMIFDRDGSLSFMPKRNFVVTRTSDLSSFTIVTDNGNTYVFDVKETCKITDTGYHASLTTPYTTAWSLSSVKSADKTNSITFTYNPTLVTSNKTLLGNSASYKLVNTSGQSTFSQTGNDNYVYHVQYSTPILQRMTFSNGYLDFKPGSRLDSSFPLLQSIELHYLDGGIFKTFSFGYDYFHIVSSDASPDILKLKLQTYGEDPLSPYRFEYAPQVKKVPNTNYFTCQDNWGFFTGRNQSTRTPQFMKFFIVDPNGTVGLSDYALIEGADMSPDLESTKMFMLIRSTNPGGARVQYDYELNTADFAVENPTVKQYGPVPLSTADPYTKGFTIPSGTAWNGGPAVITISADCGLVDGSPCADGAPPVLLSGCPLIELVGPTPYSWSCQYANRKFEIFLKPGNYQLKVSSNTAKNFSVALYYYAVDPYNQMQNKPVGGLRISRITTYKDDRDIKPIVTKYVYNDDTGKTTGKLNADVNYTYSVSRISKEPGGVIAYPDQPLCRIKNFYYSSTVSKISYALSPEYSAGYSRVTELNGENGENGKIEYYFFSNDDYSDNNNLNLNDWRRGFLQRKIIYRKQDALYKKVKETVNEYDVTSYPLGLKKTISGFSVGASMQEADACSMENVPALSKFSIFNYTLISDWYFIKKVTEINYDDLEVPVSETTDLVYDFKSLLPVKRTTERSNTDKKLVAMRNYPGNYSDASGTFISDLKSFNIVDIPIEEITFTEKTLTGGQTEIKIISGAATTYKRGDNLTLGLAGRPDGQYTLMFPNGDPIPFSSFTFTNAPTGSLPSSTPGAFSLPTAQYTQKALAEATDAMYGGPTKLISQNGIRTSFVWGNHGSNIVCRAVNSSIANFTSFEVTGEKGGWTFAGTPVVQDATKKAKTGKYYYNLNTGNITSGVLDNTKRYRITFWAKGGDPTVSNVVSGNAATGTVDIDSWRFYTRLVGNTAVVTISGIAGISIDELNLVEEGAVVECYVYDELKGLLSKTDSNGKMNVYEYDNLGRVIFIRDEKGSVLYKYTYNYTQQTTSGSVDARFAFTGALRQGKTINFISLAPSALNQYDWDFGDGSVTKNGGSSIAHTFDISGLVVATLTVTNGAQYNFTQQSLYIDPAPIINPNWPAPTLVINSAILHIQLPDPASLTVNSTATASSGGTNPLQQYEWAITSDGVSPEIFTIFSTSPTNTMVIPAAEHFYVHCRVKDANGVYSQTAITYY